MSDWSMRKVAIGVLSFMMVAFLVFTIAAYQSGKEVGSAVVAEKTFEKDSFEEPHLTFELDRETSVQTTIEGVTLSDSWVWVKTIIADSEGRPVVDFAREVSYYSGSGWEEGDPSASEVFALSPGEYKVFVHGKDAKRDQSWTNEHREKVRVEVAKGVWLARYPIIGMVMSGGLLLLVLFGTDSDD